jgi:hypothetical protein
MKLQALIEDYLALLKRENERLRSDLDNKNNQQLKQHQEAIIKRNTLIWKLILWEPSIGVESSVYNAFRRGLQEFGSYDTIDQLIDSVYDSFCTSTHSQGK